MVVVADGVEVGVALGDGDTDVDMLVSGKNHNMGKLHVTYINAVW